MLIRKVSVDKEKLLMTNCDVYPLVFGKLVIEKQFGGIQAGVEKGAVYKEEKWKAWLDGGGRKPCLLNSGS